MMGGESQATVMDEAVIDSVVSPEKILLTEKLLEFKTLRGKWIAAIAKLDGDIAAIERTLPFL